MERHSHRVARVLILAGLVVLQLAVATDAPSAQTTRRQIGRYTIEETPVGAWMLKAGSGGPTGRFCTLELRQDGNTFGYQRTAAGTAFMVISSSRWHREPATFAAVDVFAGDAAAWSGTAAAPVPEGLLLDMKEGEAETIAAAAFRAGSLRAAVEGETLRFALPDAAKALAAQDRCLESGKRP